MTTTRKAAPAYIALSSTAQSYVASTTHGLFLLGVSAAMVPPDAQEKLRLREPYEAFTTAEAAASDLIRRAEWAWEIARAPAARADLLDGLDAILGSEAPLLDVRDCRARIAGMRARLSLTVERDKNADRRAAQPVKIEGDWISRKLEALEQRVAELETRSGAAAA